MNASHAPLPPELQASADWLETVLPAVLDGWHSDKLVAVADPRMLEGFPEAAVEQMMRDCARTLGTMKQRTALASETGQMASTSYTGGFNAHIYSLACAQGTATLRVNVARVGESWRILGFWVNLNAPRASPPASAPS